MEDWKIGKSRFEYIFTFITVLRLMGWKNGKIGRIGFGEFFRLKGTETLFFYRHYRSIYMISESPSRLKGIETLAINNQYEGGIKCY